jgi:uroporphyrinogen-III synthase
MSLKVLAERMADLVGAGYPPDTAVAVVEKLGSPETRAVTGTIGTIAAIADREDVGTPAVVLVGPQFHRPDHLPLHGIRVWLPGERETAESQREPLEAAGATCRVLPLIEPVPLPVDEGRILDRSFDWVVFTSKKAVDYLFDLLGRWGLDARWFPKVAAIGSPAIEKLRARGIEPNLIPPEPTRVSLSDSLLHEGLAGQRVLLPFSEVAPDHVRERLAPHAAEVVRVDLYTVRPTSVDEAPPADVVLFTSETTVRSAKRNGLLEGIRERGMLVGGIGPGTCGRLAREGLPPDIVPDGTDPSSLARAVRRTFANLEAAVAGGRP